MGPEYERLSEADRLVLEGLRSAGEAWIVGGWVREAFSDNDYVFTDFRGDDYPDADKCQELCKAAVGSNDPAVFAGTWELSTPSRPAECTCSRTPTRPTPSGSRRLSNRRHRKPRRS